MEFLIYTAAELNKAPLKIHLTPNSAINTTCISNTQLSISVIVTDIVQYS